MKRMIPIVDLKTGVVSLRSSDTSTLDVPADFDRDLGVASLTIKVPSAPFAKVSTAAAVSSTG